MTNTLGTGTVSPREHNKHERHTKTAKRRFDNQRAEFLAVEATRLSSTAAIIAAKLLKYTPEKILSASTLDDLP